MLPLARFRANSLCWRIISGGTYSSGRICSGHMFLGQIFSWVDCLGANIPSTAGEGGGSVVNCDFIGNPVVHLVLDFLSIFLNVKILENVLTYMSPFFILFPLTMSSSPDPDAEDVGADDPAIPSVKKNCHSVFLFFLSLISTKTKYQEHKCA